MSIACFHGPTGLARGQDFSYYLSSLSALLLYTPCVPATPVYNILGIYNIMHIYICIYIYIYIYTYMYVYPNPHSIPWLIS